MLTPLIPNDYTLKNSLTFAEEVPAFNSTHYDLST